MEESPPTVVGHSDSPRGYRAYVGIALLGALALAASLGEVEAAAIQPGDIPRPPTGRLERRPPLLLDLLSVKGQAARTGPKVQAFVDRGYDVSRCKSRRGPDRRYQHRRKGRR